MAAGIMSRFHNSKVYPLFQRLLRTLQFLSALSSLIVFSIRVRKLLKLYNSLSRAEGAIEGIIAAAVLYTLAVLAITAFVRNGGPKALRWVLVVLDLAFVGAFIAVAVLTSPKGGKAGPCYGERKRRAEQNGFVDDAGCQLPLGTFITAIFSTYVTSCLPINTSLSSTNIHQSVLHALTAAFQNIRQYHGEHRAVKEHGYNE
jgi:hypothetical protein